MRKIIGICLLVNLGGCATYESRFDCNAPEGIGCRSISEINEMVNHREIGVSGGREKSSSEPLEIAYGAKSYPSDGSQKRVIRLPERTLRIWMKGFTDDKGDYIGETQVHTVVETGSWQEVE